MSRFERRSKRVDMKKAQITRKYMNDLCLNKSRMKTSSLKKSLKKYTKQMSKLEMKKYGFSKPIIYREITDPDVYGSMSYHNGLRLYKEKGRTKLGTGSILSVNYDIVAKKLRSQDLDTRTSGFIKFMETVHHEMSHLEQHVATEDVKKIDDVSSEYSLKYALEFVAIAENRNVYYKKGDNYRKMLVEQNAREKGMSSTLDVLSKTYKKSFLQKWFGREKLEKFFNDTFVELENLEGETRIRNRHSMTTEYADKAIKRNPVYLKQMPILQKAYTMDGNRKPLYQIVRENAKATRRLKMNPFILPKAKKEKIQEVQDLYSEIFSETLKQVDEEDLELTKRVLGNKAFRSMINIARDHYSRKYEEMEKNAKEEVEMREHIIGISRENRTIYRERMDSNLDRYAPYINLLNEADEYVRELRVEKMTPDEVKEQLEKDKLQVKHNIEQRKTKSIPKSSASRVATRLQYEDVVLAEENENVDLEGMREVKEGYSKLKDVKVKELENTREVYYTELKKSKEKKQEIGVNTKEK